MRAVAHGGRRGAARLARRRRLRSLPPRGAQTAAGAAVEQLGGEQLGHVVDEGRPHRGPPVVVAGVPAERQQVRRARRRGVEEQPLGRERVLVVAQPQPRGGVDLAAVLVAQERVGPRRTREHALVEPADEQRPHAPRAQVLRPCDLHAAGPRVLADEQLELAQRAQQVLTGPRQRRVGLDEPAELVERLARHRGHATVEPLPAGEHRRLAGERGGEEPRGLAREPPAERRGAALRVGAHLVDRVERERRVKLLPQRARRRRAARALLARPLLEVVGEPRHLQEAGRAQPGEQVVGGRVVLRAARQRDQPAPERGVAQRDAPRHH